MEGSNILLGIILLLLLYLALKPSKQLNFPPGPRFWFPILGHIPLLGLQPHKRLMAWKSTYGPIVGLWFGNHRAIAISDPELIREALNSPSLGGRPPLGLFRDWGLGLAMAEGQHHSDQRKFTLKQMKDYGFGSTSTEAKIQDEVLSTLQDLKQHVGKPLCLDGAFEKTAGKIIWDFLMDEPAKKEEVDHELFKTLGRMASLLRDSTVATGIVMFLPWLANLFPKFSGLEAYQTSNQQIEAFIKGRVDLHDKSREDSPRDFVDAYMEQVSKTGNHPDSVFHPRHNSVVQLVRDLLIGGSDTVGTSITWLVAYLVTWPDVQRKLQHEIDAVVGQGRYPSLNDRRQMPYTVAVIYELLRFSSLFSLGPVHRATEDNIFRGYYIPKGTIVIPNFYATHFDEKIWGDPQNFRPERFLLDGSGKDAQQMSENLMPFSVGKRACPGEAIAMDELFLFTVHLLQAFKVKAAGTELPCLDPNFGVTMTPSRFEVILTARRE